MAASLFGNRLAATLPAHLPGPAVAAAKGSVGGALIAAHVLARLGLAGPAHQLSGAAVNAFLYSQRGGCLVAAGVTFLGALLAAALLPARPRPERADQPTQTSGEAVR